MRILLDIAVGGIAGFVAVVVMGLWQEYGHNFKRLKP